IATGRSKVGCFIGDHTKTGLETLINTGSNIGIFCNLLPAGPLAPQYGPRFASWGNGTLCESFAWGELLATAHKAMKRRARARAPPAPPSRPHLRRDRRRPPPHAARRRAAPPPPQRLMGVNPAQFPSFPSVP